MPTPERQYRTGYVHVTFPDGMRGVVVLEKEPVVEMDTTALTQQAARTLTELRAMYPEVEAAGVVYGNTSAMGSSTFLRKHGNAYYAYEFAFPFLDRLVAEFEATHDGDATAVEQFTMRLDAAKGTSGHVSETRH